MEEATAPTSSRLARLSLWLFLAVFVFCASLTKGHFEGSDQMELYQTSQGLWEKGTLHTLGSFTIFRDRWLSYAHTSVGSAVLALPLYGAGKLADRTLSAAGFEKVRNALAGPVIEVNPTWRWGGEVPIFFVDLFPALAVAATCVLFLFFNLRLGVAPPWALAGAILLGTCSYLAYNGAEFFQHPAESLFLLLAVFLLSEDFRRPRRRIRWLAGAASGALFLCRYQTAIALPVLLLGATWSSSRAETPLAVGSARFRRLLRDTAPFAIPVAFAVVAHFAINYSKLGVLTLIPESASNEPFHFHFLNGLYGLIASPGAGILLFCPLLALLPWTIPHFRARRPFETALIGGLAFVYLVFYANFDYWSGQWCYGPRYLTALVPLLFLALPGWMESRGERGWRFVAPLAVAGLVVVLLGAAVNYSYEYFAAGYSNYKPMYGFVYSIRDSQLVTNTKAVLAGNYCVDLWLVQLSRRTGPRVAFVVAASLAAVFGLRGSEGVAPRPRALDGRESRVAALRAFPEGRRFVGRRSVRRRDGAPLRPGHRLAMVRRAPRHEGGDGSALRAPRPCEGGGDLPSRAVDESGPLRGDLSDRQGARRSRTSRRGDALLDPDARHGCPNRRRGDPAPRGRTAGEVLVGALRDAHESGHAGALRPERSGRGRRPVPASDRIQSRPLRREFPDWRRARPTRPAVRGAAVLDAGREHGPGVRGPEHRKDRARSASPGTVTPEEETAERERFTGPAAALLLLFVALVVSAGSQKSETFDEGLYVAGGAAQVLHADPNIRFGHPPLLRWISGIPSVVFGGARLPGEPPWIDRGAVDFEKSVPDLFLYSVRFFYDGGNDHDRVLFWGRFPFALLGALLGWLIFSTARRRFGPWPALGALVLFLFTPEVLAHSQWAHADLASALTIFLVALALERALRDPSPRAVALLGGALGIAASTKLTGLLLVPPVFLLLAALLPGKAPCSRRAPGDFCRVAFLRRRRRVVPSKTPTLRPRVLPERSLPSSSRRARSGAARDSTP